MRIAGAEYGQALVSWSHVAKNEKIAFLLDVKNRTNCLDLSFSNTSVYFFWPYVLLVCFVFF